MAKKIVFALCCMALSATCVQLAQAAETRASIFGVELGTPISLLRCDIQSVGGIFGSGGTDMVQSEHSDMCWGPPQFAIDSASTTPKSMPTNGDLGIYFASGHLPTFAAQASFDVSLKNGVVDEIRMQTDGLRHQADAIEALKEKFGAPQDSHYDHLQNLAGASFDVLNAKWILSSGDVVQFQGYIDGLGIGILAVMSADAAKEDAARKAKFAAPKL